MNDLPCSTALLPPDIDAVLVRLADHQATLSCYIDLCWSELDAVHLARLLSLHGQNAASLCRLLRDWRAVHGDPPDILDQAIDQALDELSAEWGVDLGPSANPSGEEPAQLPIDVDEVIADLDGKCTRLERHLAQCSPGGDDKGLSRLFAVYSRNMAHLGRLVRVRHALYRRTPQEIEALIAQALAELEEESGTDA